MHNLGKSFQHFSNRLQSQDMYLDFIDEPANSLRRKREGLYVSYTFGQGDKAVKVKNDALIIKADPWATLRAENKYVIH